MKQNLFKFGLMVIVSAAIVLASATPVRQLADTTPRPWNPTSTTLMADTTPRPWNPTVISTPEV